MSTSVGTRRQIDVGGLLPAEGATGAAYEVAYSQYLNVLAVLAHFSPCVECTNVPRSWAPLVAYMGHVVVSTTRWCAEDDMGVWMDVYEHAEDPRHALEVICALRPELVHALYLCDVHWPVVSHAPGRQAFTITTNNGFFRPEIRAYLANLAAYQPPRKTPYPRACVLVPCSAHKPYPSHLHQAVLDRIGEREDSPELIVVSGALGLCPKALWKVAPLYDAGLPNHERVRQTVAWYFARWSYREIIVYVDFYAHAIAESLPDALRQRTRFVLGTHPRDTYDDLLAPANLRLLEQALS